MPYTARRDGTTSPRFLALEIGQRTPHPKQGLPSKVLAIVAGQRVGARDLNDQIAMLLEPIDEQRFLIS